MLIIEGSDCLGKTTFANLLVSEAAKRERFPVFYSHMSRPNSSFDFFNHYTDMMTKYAVQDRFHLGGIVWHDAFKQPALDIIDGRLKAIGSMTLIMYASDGEWYRKLIEKDERGNMLSIDKMCEANQQFRELVKRDRHRELVIDFNFKWDVTPNKIATPNFPDKIYANCILNNWFERLELLS